MTSVALPAANQVDLHDTWELEQALGQVYDWDLNITQLNRGKFQGSFYGITSGGLQLVQVQINCRILAVGAKPIDSWIFAVPLLPVASLSVTHAVKLPQTNCIFGFDDQREINLLTPSSGYHLALVIVSKALFRHYAATAGRYDLDDAFMRRNMIQVGSQPYSSLVSYLQEVFCVAQHQPTFLQSASAAHILEKDLLPLLIQALNVPLENPKLRPSRRAELVATTQLLMAANLQNPITLDDICQTVCASKRALNYGFQEIFAMAPMAFLKVQRLNGIHRALLAADPSQHTVAQLAKEWGFWSMGHFARDYKQLFGEGPSQTLAREASS
jgi:AraC family ethanolamine operon transcriptional activator